jgi:hypothetical protein
MSRIRPRGTGSHGNEECKKDTNSKKTMSHDVLDFFNLVTLRRANAARLV